MKAKTISKTQIYESIKMCMIGKYTSKIVMLSRAENSVDLISKQIHKQFHPKIQQLVNPFIFKVASLGYFHACPQGAGA